MNNSFTARFFDGKQLAPFQAQVDIRAASLVIHYTERELAKTVEWPASSLQIMEPPFQDRPAVIGSKEMVGARLIIAHTENYQQILPLVSRKNIKAGNVAHSWRTFGWITLCIGFSIFVFFGLINLGAPIIANAIPPGWDDKMGRYALKSMTLNYQECATKTGKNALQKIVHRLDNQHNFNVKVIIANNDKEANAFAVPGFHIIILGGLIQAAQTPEEVAGVLAHEMGHSIQHHPTIGLLRRLGINVITALSFGTETAADFFSTLVNLKNSRHDESEADEIALVLLKRAQISAQGLHDFFNKHAEPQATVKFPWLEYWEDYLSTHPAPATRMKYLAQQPEYATIPLLTQQEWQALKNICKQRQPLKFDTQ